MFSGFYLAFLLLLVALIARGVSFEFRGKRDSPGWRRAWDLATTGGSLLAPLLIGLALGNLLGGVPIGSDQEYTGTFTDLLNGYALFCGVTVVLLCASHGASYLALKTTGEVRDRAMAAGRMLGPLAAAAVTGFAIWTLTLDGDGSPLALLTLVLAVVAALAAAWQVGRGRDGIAFAATTLTVAAVVVSIFVSLYPRVMVSSLGAATDLTVTNTSSSPYTLKVMTVAAAVLFPVVLAYQAWTYHVFRSRVR
jgi:cytochrome d ubiquinol oxidase subunit II